MSNDTPSDAQIEAAARAISLDLTGDYHDPELYRTTARVALEAAAEVIELDLEEHHEP